jgi:hypothetical protein
VIGARHYAIITAAYWAFTLTDGALRLQVLLHFHELGYTPVQLAFLFLLYEFFGIVTNLVGGWLAARTGLRLTLVLGLALQVAALGLLALLNREWGTGMSVAYVMACQALSGIAKDLTKMSAKSAVKVLVPQGDESGLFRWVAVLTGSKNALKGAGFFLGGLLLATLGFQGALMAMAGGVLVVLAGVLITLPASIGQAKSKPPFKGVLSNSSGINRLSLARMALFAARDVWFVVSVPIFLAGVLGWTFTQIGAFLALCDHQHARARACCRHGSHPDRPPSGRPAVGGHARRPRALWHCLRAELGRALVSRPRLFGSRPRLAQRGVLLHGECGWAPDGHPLVRGAVSSLGRDRLALGSGHSRRHGRSRRDISSGGCGTRRVMGGCRQRRLTRLVIGALSSAVGPAEPARDREVGQVDRHQ